jgi:tricorn protease
LRAPVHHGFSQIGNAVVHQDFLLFFFAFGIPFSLLLAGTAFTGHADEARLLRFPATNGSDIVFSYAGDLYKAPLNGGEAQKLTSHIGYEMFARFSPDGKSIAFTGQYDGNTEVYLIPTDGGEPQRLTYTATNSRDDLGDRMGPNNIVMTWTPDGKNIVYRNRISCLLFYADHFIRR